MSTWVIGDVHGNLDALTHLRKRFDQGDDVIFVGDLIDRGAQSREVVALVKGKGYVCVMGNHEYMFVRAASYLLSKTNRILFAPSGTYADLLWCLENGGEATFASYGVTDPLKALRTPLPSETAEALRRDAEWISALPLAIRLDAEIAGLPVVVSHACVSDVWHHIQADGEDKAFTEFQEAALWNRKPPKTSNPPIFNIFGHTPQPRVVVGASHVCVDTGCAFGKKGMLSAYCVEDGIWVSVPCR